MRVSLSLRLWWIVAIAPNPPYRLIRRTAVQGLTNYFRVESHFVDEQGQSLGDASAAIFITYILDVQVFEFSVI